MSDSCYNFDLEPSEKKMKLEVFGEESVLSDHLVTDDSIQFPSSSGVEKLSNEEIIKEENSDEEGGSGSDDDCSSNDGNVIIVHMDIREPLSTLRSLLHKKVNLDLTLHVFTLQGNQQLESSKTLVDQCIQGEGIVQINVKIRENTKPKAIDIVDVLKPDDDYNEDLEEDVSMAKEDTKLSTNERRLRFMKAIQQAKDGVSLPNGWIQDIDFTYKLIRYSIPINPMEWEPSHVKHWLLWAVREFNLVGINLQDWANMPGYLLCAMTQKDFSRRVQQDPGDVFWQHCQILKVYKTVAVRTKDRMRNLKDLDETIEEPEDEVQKKETQDKNNDKSIELDDESNHSNSESNVSYLNMVEEDKDPKSFKTSFGSVKLQQFQHFMGRQNDLKGLGGSTSLWQFLLELLVDWRYRDCIQWTGSTGEFEMLQPDIVAKMWGIRKNKPNMNYDKLSRALRYYYDGDMIAKVCGKKYVYRFICDLKFLLGYSPKELNDRVIKAEKRFKKKDK